MGSAFQFTSCSREHADGIVCATSPFHGQSVQVHRLQTSIHEASGRGSLSQQLVSNYTLNRPRLLWLLDGAFWFIATLVARVPQAARLAEGLAAAALVVLIREPTFTQPSCASSWAPLYYPPRLFTSRLIKGELRGGRREGCRGTHDAQFHDGASC